MGPGSRQGGIAIAGEKGIGDHTGRIRLNVLVNGVARTENDALDIHRDTRRVRDKCNIGFAAIVPKPRAES